MEIAELYRGSTGIIGCILGSYRDKGKENASYCSIILQYNRVYVGGT